MKMELKVLLCLVPAFVFTMQESLKLDVSSEITTECDKPVYLHCNTSLHNGLSVKRMEWSQGNMSLCSVDSQETITSTQRHFESNFHCSYKDGRLTLVFRKVLPLESGKPFRCKLQSNKGVAHDYTRLQLQECCRTVEAVMNSHGPSCTFKHAYPDGEVHWYYDSTNISEKSVRHQTAKSIDNHGWMIIRSWLTFNSTLERESHKSYNCSLKSSTSGKYIASSLILTPELLSSGGDAEYNMSDGNGVRSLQAVKIALTILVSLIVQLE
ncbi:uncharacterized protein LOC119774224 [Cyprinodon tularosa]|uniref:uncharacterized protein LOC119774224 n=1 Tax=Cyprinodon tularosa TaxID=77115 RepID=UPI0018E201F0|nr:uncharacterized protein LOC119774224 [Cyprinodon tularosa]